MVSISSGALWMDRYAPAMNRAPIRAIGSARRLQSEQGPRWLDKHAREIIRHLRGIWDNPLDPAMHKSKKLVGYPTPLGEGDRADPNDLVP
jgi:hypothetical protein